MFCQRSKKETTSRKESYALKPKLFVDSYLGKPAILLNGIMRSTGAVVMSVSLLSLYIYIYITGALVELISPSTSLVY